MEDKTYIQALMNAQSREERDVSMKQAVASEDFQERWKSTMQVLSSAWKQIKQASSTVLRTIIAIWKRIQRAYRTIRKDGTAREKRVMWKMMHPPSSHRRRGRH